VNSELALLYCALAGYALAALLSLLRRVRGSRGRGAAPLVVSALAIALHAGFVVIRTGRVGFLPFASRFESMALFALAIEAAGLAVYVWQSSDSAKAATGAFSSVLLAVVVFAVGWVPGGSLNPILDSAWFAVHILVAFAAYGLVVAGLAWSAAALLDRHLADAEVPRRLALYASCLLGTAILVGALWADISWGTYWNWDPKESWALLTWTVLAGYAHLRPRRWLSLAGFGLAFAVMMFTFVGINLLKWGAHKY
jgi:ABC-type transport system involved in cytochrome c biogenesis permease subunit